MAIILLLMSAFIVAVAYMVAYALSNQMLMAWAKSEFFQVMASTFILGATVGLLFTIQLTLAQEINASGAASGIPVDLCDTTSISASGVPNCHIELAYAYLDIIYNDASATARDIMAWNTVFILLRGLSLGIDLFAPPYFGINLVPLAGLGILSESITTALDIIIKVMMVIKVQQILLNYIETALFPILMVMGLVFRSFFFTRRLGGLLIAIAIGIYLVYPLVYVFAHNIWLNTIYKDRSAAIGYNTNINSYTWQGHIHQNITEVVSPTVVPGETLYDKLLKMSNRRGGLYDDFMRYVSGDFIIGEGGMLEKTAILLVYATFIPFIALMVTIGFVRGLSISIGGDVEIAGLTRFI